MDDIKITGLRTRAVNVPLQYTLKTAGGTIATVPLVLIDLLTDANVTGHAYVFTYTPLALKPIQSLIDELGAVVNGLPLAPFEIEPDAARSARSAHRRMFCNFPSALESVAPAFIYPT